MSEKYDLYPQKHILPYDGMSITANVWNESHEYHRSVQNAHQAYLHGDGIVTGLEVIASDPPDRVVYVLPGIAIDQSGNMIVLSEPVAYEMGDKVSGKLRLYLLHREIKTLENRTEENNQPAYIQDEFVIIAREEEINAPAVELARILRDQPQSLIIDAVDPANPGVNAIDLRFRKPLGQPAVQQILCGVCLLGEPNGVDYLRALNNLAGPLAAQTPYHLIVDGQVPLDTGIFQYSFLYILANPKKALNHKQCDALQAFSQNGGCALIEFSETVEPTKAKDYLDMVGFPVANLDASGDFWRTPNLFIFPPQGAYSGNEPVHWLAQPGLLVSTGGYGQLWSGSVRQPAYTREVLRSALEWGVNLTNGLLSSRI